MLGDLLIRMDCSSNGLPAMSWHGAQHTGKHELLSAVEVSVWCSTSERLNPEFRDLNTMINPSGQKIATLLSAFRLQTGAN